MACRSRRAYNTNMHITFKNNWGWHMGGTLGQLGNTYDDRAARGGPAVRQDRYISPWLSINGDDRKVDRALLQRELFRGAGGKGNWSLNLSPEIDYKMMGRFSSALSSWAGRTTSRTTSGTATSTTRRARTTPSRTSTRHTTSVTARLNYTFTPDVSLQAYLQPFVSKGTYSNVRQLSATPRAAAYDDRYAPYINPSVTANPGGFNFKAFQSNVVFRWEYKPGSTLFAVWNQGRQGFLGAQGRECVPGDVRDLFRLHPANTFLVKMSYWLNRS